MENVQIGTGAMVFWVDSPAYGHGNDAGDQTGRQRQARCARSSRSPRLRQTSTGLSYKTARSGLAAVAWADDRIGNNGIYIQNINSNCTLGQK